MYLNVLPPLSGYLFGLTMTSGTSTNLSSTLSVAPGVAADSTGTYLFQLSAEISKVLAGPWAAGSTANGLDTGTRANNTWYHVFLIRNDSTGTADILFSTSYASPTMPAGYSHKRRIGSVKTDGSGNITPFTQTEDEFIWAKAAYDVQSYTSLGTSSVNFALSVPPDVKVQARLRAGILNNTVSVQCTVRSPDEDSSQNSTFGTGSGHQIQTPGGSEAAMTELLVRTNTSRQVAALSTVASGNTFHIRTVGWFDTRGRLS